MNTTLHLRRFVPIALIALATVGVGAAVIAANDDADDRPIPVEPDGGIGDTPIPVEPDGGIGDTPIPVEPDGGIGDTPGDEFPVDEARQAAKALLGVSEEQLDADVRVARRGDEQYALTEDYQPGRMTVELDDDGDGFQVTAVTLELPDGPVTFELAAG